MSDNTKPKRIAEVKEISPLVQQINANHELKALYTDALNEICGFYRQAIREITNRLEESESNKVEEVYIRMQEDLQEILSTKTEEVNLQNEIDKAHWRGIFQAGTIAVIGIIIGTVIRLL